MPYLLNYRWPGNVRELENLMERLVLLSRTEEVTSADLPERLRQSAERVKNLRIPILQRANDLKTVERDLILQVLRQCNWNKSRLPVNWKSAARLCCIECANTAL